LNPRALIAGHNISKKIRQRKTFEDGGSPYDVVDN